MKKLLALLLTSIMLFAFAGCAGSEDVRGNINSDTNSEVSSGETETEEKEFSLGITSGNNYENTFLGIGCNLDENWTFYTDDQIKELNNIVTDAAGDELAAQIEDAEIIYDMYATHSNGLSNMNINLENVGLIENATIDLATRLENTVPSIKEMLTNMGCSNIMSEGTTVEIDGEEFVGLNISAEISGTKMYETILCIKSGKYIASVTVCTFGEDTTRQLFDSFYVIK